MDNYQNYLFDLYGTLVDVHTDEHQPLFWNRLCILLAMEGVHYNAEALERKYFAEVQAREAQARKERGQWAEIDIAAVFAAIYEEKGCPADAEKIAALARAFRVLSLEKLRIFPGAEQMLERLRAAGKRVYLLSNAQLLFTLPEVQALGLDRYFDGIIISSCEGLKKPDSRLYHLALERYALEPGHTVMVGNDDQADCWGAANAGLDSMYVYTEQSPERTKALPVNCRLLKQIGDVF